jgi:hypothetical protein
VATSAFISTLLLTLFSAAAGVVSIGEIVPFIAILTQPKKIFNYSVIAQFGVINAAE